MTPFTPSPLDCPDLILVPTNEASLLLEIENTANPRQKISLIGSIRKSLISIRHKLTISMYQSALIYKSNPNEFNSFEDLDRLLQKPLVPSKVEYKGSLYTMEDIDHYRLFMTFFIETFAATNFSLLDVCGHLLNELYGLQVQPEKVSFHKIYQELYKKRSSPPDPVLNVLSRFDIGHTNATSWIKALKEVRNRTTHRPITDICIVQTVRRRDLYTSDTPSEISHFVLKEGLFPLSAPPVKLGDFAIDVFQGIQVSIDDLYEALRQAIEQQRLNGGELPLS